MIKFEGGKFERGGFEGEKFEWERKEKEKIPKTKILVLEDQFAQVAREGLNLPHLETKIVSSIEELEEIDPKEFAPDIVILDLEVPEKKGKEPEYNEKLSTKIVNEKFKEPLIIYYTSFLHHDKLRGGVGDYPDIARSYGLRFYLENKYEDLLKIDPELKNIADKSNPENWKRVLEVLPIVCSGPKLTEKIELIAFWPDETKKKILSLVNVDNPELAKAIKRRWDSVLERK